MTDQPGLQTRISPADEFETSGPHAARVREFAERFLRHHRLGELNCHIEVASAPLQHIGLGTGTQLGLSVVAGLSEFFGLDRQRPADLAKIAGRGSRSSIGTYGFCKGGFIYEEVKAADATVAPLCERVSMPEDWRWLLLRPKSEVGLSGQSEKDAFCELPPVPVAATSKLRAEVSKHMLPAIKSCDFDEFGASLYRYGVMAGACFSARQGGPFASAKITKCVETIRELGVPGVGQSSWGPTIFSLCSSSEAARGLAEQLSNSEHATEFEILISQPNNTGAIVEIKD